VPLGWAISFGNEDVAEPLSCPQLAEADISPTKPDSRFDPERK
jgi:hypothetical protein